MKKFLATFPGSRINPLQVVARAAVGNYASIVMKQMKVGNCRQINKLPSPHPNHGKNFGAERHMPCMFATRPPPSSLTVTVPTLPRTRVSHKSTNYRARQYAEGRADFAERSLLRGEREGNSNGLILIEPPCLGDRFPLRCIKTKSRHGN